MKEQRNYVRYNVLLEESVGLECVHDSEKVCVSDISYTGAGLSLKKRVSLGQTIKLEISVPGDDIPMFVTAVVAWVSKQADQDGLYRTGVRLFRVSSSDKQRLLAYLNKRLTYI